MKQVQRGFTLIELVMVIVILGVLAAVALPKFVDLKGDAQAAATKGVGGGISSASSVNYATWAASAGSKGVSVNSATACTNTVVNSILQSPLSAEYTVSGTLDCSAGLSGASAVCTVTDNGTPAHTADAVMICAK